MAKPAEVEPKWWVVDAAGKAVGRLATEIAVILMGKHLPHLHPPCRHGDYVIVLNVDKVVFTGNKWDAKQYTWYTGYTGLRSETAGSDLRRNPSRSFTTQSAACCPRNKLARKMLEKLRSCIPGRNTRIRRRSRSDRARRRHEIGHHQTEIKTRCQKQRSNVRGRTRFPRDGASQEFCRPGQGSPR